VAGDPFRARGLTADAGLTDDDIRSAWHRVAAATHPDRADGGDPAAFSAAAAAYSELRSPFGRGEARAALAGDRPRERRRPRPRGRPARAAPGRRAQARPAGRAVVQAAGRRMARVRAGRPGRLAGLVLAGALAGVLAVVIDGWRPASVAIIVGAATWVLRGARRYLGARPAAGGGSGGAGMPRP
jgi:curved DNA-binding protein CbpA